MGRLVSLCLPLNLVPGDEHPVPEYLSLEEKLTSLLDVHTWVSSESAEGAGPLPASVK